MTYWGFAPPEWLVDEKLKKEREEKKVKGAHLPPVLYVVPKAKND